MNIIKRIDIMQRVLRDCIVINLLSHSYRLILVDKTAVVCSLKLDLNEETFFVMIFDENDNPIRFGRGVEKENVITLENIDFRWKDNSPLTQSAFKPTASADARKGFTCVSCGKLLKKFGTKHKRNCRYWREEKR